MPNSTAFNWPFQLASGFTLGPEYGMSSGELPDLLLLASSSLETARCIARYALLARVDQHQQRGRSTRIHTRKLNKTPDAISKVQINQQVGGWTSGSGGLAQTGRHYEGSPPHRRTDCPRGPEMDRLAAINQTKEGPEETTEPKLLSNSAAVKLLLVRGRLAGQGDIHVGRWDLEWDLSSAAIDDRF